MVAHQCDIGACAAHVQRDHVGPTRGAGRVDCPDHAGCGSRQRRAYRKPTGTLDRHQPAARLVNADWRVRDMPRQFGLEEPEVAAHDGLQKSVQHRGREPLILAKLGLDLGRQRDMHRAIRPFLKRPTDAPLVAVVDIGKQQTHRAGLGARSERRGDRLIDRRIAQRQDRFSGGRHPLLDLETPLAWHQRCRVVDLEVVHMGPRLTSNLQQIAEALGRDQRDRAALSLDQRVGCNGGPRGRRVVCRQPQCCEPRPWRRDRRRSRRPDSPASRDA